MTMTLQEAIAEVRNYAPDAMWIKEDFQSDHDTPAMSEPHSEAIATILNAVASGDMIPRTDSEMAVAAAYQRAHTLCENVAKGYDRAGDNAIGNGIRIAGGSIIALADKDPLAEIQALKAERDALFRKAALAEEWRDHDRDRAIAAEAEAARLKAALNRLTNPAPGVTEILPPWALAIACVALTTPEKDATP